MKKKRIILCFITIIAFFACAYADTGFIDEKTIGTVTQTLLKKHGEQNHFRIERGVKQAALFWTEKDGSKEEFVGLCQQYFIGSPQILEANFKKLENYGEILGGFFREMALDLRQTIDLDLGEIFPIDRAFGQFNPAAHLTEDLFKNKMAFFILLNFPHYSLEEMTKLGEKWSRKEWAYARVGGQFNSRTPASINQEINKIISQAGLYIAQYNIFMGKLVDNKMKTYFPEKMKLISHWGIRDEIKARYVDPIGLFKQKMIYKVMERIINQEIPGKVVNNNTYQWNPYANKVYEKGKEIKVNNEPDTRYQHLLNVYKTIKETDAYNPYIPNFVKRRFEAAREIPEAEVEALFVELISSKEVKKVAKLIRKRLKRKLYPFDIWYPGFRSDVSVKEEELDKMVSKKYTDVKAFEAGIYDILLKLGFTENRAKFIAPKIQVDPARGAGHCAGAGMKTAKTRLRTRVPKGGMNYKGFNTAMHELGHAVEQTLTLQDMDYFSLTGIPNAAFTEAFAFMFQDRDLDVLGIKQDQTKFRRLKTLDIFWNAYEIMGVSLVDMKAWNWLYKNPDTTPAQLKKAVISIAKDIWNKYYAPVFKVKDQSILAIYSHMIAYPLYLPDYPIGHVIQFQIESWMEGKDLTKETERLCSSGNILPQQWMKNGVGSKISVKPLLKAVNESLKYIKK